MEESIDKIAGIGRTMPGEDRHSAYQYSAGAFKFEKVTIGDQEASKWFYFANQGNNGYTKNIWIGAGGLNFADGTVLGFNFTQKKAAPVLDLTDKTVTMNGEVKVKVIVLAIKSTGIYILVR